MILSLLGLFFKQTWAFFQTISVPVNRLSLKAVPLFLGCWFYLNHLLSNLHNTIVSDEKCHLRHICGPDLLIRRNSIFVFLCFSFLQTSFLMLPSQATVPQSPSTHCRAIYECGTSFIHSNKLSLNVKPHYYVWVLVVYSNIVVRRLWVLEFIIYCVESHIIVYALHRLEIWTVVSPNVRPNQIRSEQIIFSLFKPFFYCLVDLCGSDCWCSCAQMRLCRCS